MVIIIFEIQSNYGLDMLWRYARRP